MQMKFVSLSHTGRAYLIIIIHWKDMTQSPFITRESHLKLGTLYDTVANIISQFKPHLYTNNIYLLNLYASKPFCATSLLRTRKKKQDYFEWHTVLRTDEQNTINRMSTMFSQVNTENEVWHTNRSLAGNWQFTGRGLCLDGMVLLRFWSLLNCESSPDVSLQSLFE